MSYWYRNRHKIMFTLIAIGVGFTISFFYHVGISRQTVTILLRASIDASLAGIAIGGVILICFWWRWS